MQQPTLQHRLSSYEQWKSRLSRAIDELEIWLESHRRATPRAREDLRAARHTLQRDRLSVALVADSARGKTDLINAIFLSNGGGPMLPPTPHNSAVCPIELLWDQARDEAYVRLLPVETRAQGIPIADLKGDSRYWVHYPLNIQLPEQMAATIGEIYQTKSVSLAEATRLGLSSAAVRAAEHRTADERIEIPKWRYAVVSFPHPLLKQGLSIFDTPGSGPLGLEPELAASVLPAMQAALFVLAAEQGVTRGDLEIWQQRLQGFQSGRRATLVALNKTDVLWDELRDPQAFESAVAARRCKAAELVGIGEDAVYPVSARMGLLAKAQNDETLLHRSGLPALEHQLAERLLQTKRQTLTELIDKGVGQVLERNRTRVASRMGRIKAQLEELEQLRDKSQEVISQLLERTRQEEERYMRGVHRFQLSREELLAQTRSCRHKLERERIASIVANADRAMAISLTSIGLGRAMHELLDNLREEMHTVATECERIRGFVRETYRMFREDLGGDLQSPKVFVPTKHRVEIEQLFQEVESFRRSPAMMLATRNGAIRLFRDRIASRALVLFDQLRAAFDRWIRETLRPLADQIQENKLAMEERLENLQRIGRSKDSLQERIDDLQGQYVAFAQTLTALRNIHSALYYDPLTEQDAPGKLRLVASG